MEDNSQNHLILLNLFNTSDSFNILNILQLPLMNSGNNIMNRSFEDQGGATHPTEKNFVENLKHIVFNEDQKEISCGICLETFKKDDKAIMLPCKDNSHYFHFGEDKEICEGILPWLKDNNTCPICRETFPEENDVKDVNVSNESETENDVERFLESIISFENVGEEGLVNEVIEEEVIEDNDEDDDFNIEEDNDEVNIENNVRNELLSLFVNAIVNGSNIGIQPGGNGPPGRITANYEWNIDNDDDDLELQEAIERSINER